MKTALRTFLTLVLLLLTAGERQVKYFKNEYDFLTGHNIPKSEVLRTAHIRAEYDDLNRLITKSNIDRLGQITVQEQYSYIDTHTTIRQKDVVNPEGRILFKTIFGREPQSLSYIEWVFGVDSVKKWDDRFTTSELNEIDKPDNYRFFDVDAFEYGGKELDYDSTGRITRDEWFRRPDGKSMHKFIYQYYDDTNITHVFEYDSNGVLIMDVKLSPDGTEAVFWFTGPSDSTFRNMSEMAYNLDGDLSWGYINWVVPGELDSARVDLTDLIRGNYNLSLPSDSVLRDSAVYDIHFDGMGTKGYMATKRTINHVTYDISPPLMTIEMDKYIKDVSLSFTHSEPIVSAYLVWAPDSNYAHIVADTVHLTEAEIDREDRFKPTHQIGLVDGVMYDPEIYAVDRAGNLSNPPGIIEDVIFDATPPILAIYSPYNGAWVNHQLLDIGTNEPIRTWTVTATWQGGTADNNAPYEHIFPDTVLDTSHVDLATLFQLNDGSIYQFSIVGEDLAGNISAPTAVDSIHYDVTPPVLTMIYPFDGAAINDPTVSYATSEQLLAGEFRWSHMDGTPDSLAPHIVLLDGDELSPAEKIRIHLQNEPTLSDGAIYSVLLTGRDLAGNESEPITISNILYDTTPPEFTNTAPVSGDALNHQSVSYTLSESIQKGNITWTQTGGATDENSPHVVIFTADEMAEGDHDSFVLSAMPTLQDGSIYLVEFMGTDRAGNHADTIRAFDVLYDYTPPEMIIEFPLPRSISNTTNMTYTLSEDLHQGEFKWVWLGGVDDTLAPYIAELNLEEMTEGRHSDIALSETPAVVENALYTLSFSGQDRAGNKTLRAFVPGLQYDFTPPTLTWYAPRPGDAVNHKNVSFENSELLKRGTISWVWVSGEPDPDSVHVMNLTGDELNSDPFMDQPIANAPPLVDGASYNITYVGFDPAGNESNHILIETVLYDVTQPEITIHYPLHKSISNKSTVSYTLSEEIYSGNFKWRWLGGEADPSAPYSAILTDAEKTVGEHMDVQLSNNPTVVEKALYTLTFLGQDRAGNRTKPAFVSGLQYDFTPPELAIISPKNGEAINHKQVHYENSEILETAQMIWRWTGGAPDTNSPHSVELSGNELLGGKFGPMSLAQSPNLVDGAEYTLRYVAFDPAGNQSDTVITTKILYDITPPVIAITYPQSDIFTTETQVQFNITEDLYGFNMDWLGKFAGRPDNIVSYNHDGVLSSGEYSSDNLFIPELSDGFTYTVTLNGTDRAGNEAIPAKITDVRIDLTPPEFTDLIPTSGYFINHMNFGWSLSEDIEEGSISFTHPNGTIEVPLSKNEMGLGTREPRPLENDLQLNDGQEYSINIRGKDFAGNESEILSVNQITYDISPPRLAMGRPSSDSFVNTLDVVYQSNEPLTSGQMVWIDAKGQSLNFEIRSNDLTEGRHTLLDYGVEPTEGISYSILIKGTDRATNEGVSDTITNVMFDITPPQLTLISPQPNGSVNHTKVSIDINEAITSGSIRWERVEGGNDPNSPHIRPIPDAQLAGGRFENLEMATPPNLVDGVVYDITIDGTDLAGNRSKPFTITNVTYDVTPPQFVDISPQDNAFIRETNITYTLTEDLETGKIYFDHVGGTPDPKTTHMITLAGSKKQMGIRGGKLPSSFISLVNGAIYNVRFEGVDAAGNTSPEATIKQIVFDNEAPVITVSAPTGDGYFKDPNLYYNLSEKLVSGTLAVDHVGGMADGKAPHNITLNEKFRSEGENLIPSIPWVDGATYNVSFDGTDRAGNTAKSVQLKNITYDVTPPIITIDNISNNSSIPDNTLSYSLSEYAAEATLVFTHVGGESDARSPQTISLTGNELNGGVYIKTSLKNGPDLVNGAIYDIQFTAIDPAGNEATPINLTNIAFDNQSPKLSISRPIDAEQIKTTIVSYMSDEDLASGYMIFTQTSGTTDVNSPHRIPLKGSNLTAGVHSDVDLGITSQLADGGRYEVTIEAYDKAGNMGEVIPIRDVFFDILPPELSLSVPESGSHVNTAQLTYATSEEMGKGQVVFTQSGGANDPNSPHTVELTGSRLKNGDHISESFDNDVTLKDGSIYTIELSGEDLAGNVAVPVSLKEIAYDVSPPAIAISSPAPNGFYNKMITGFTLNEPLVSGQIVFDRSGGASDNVSPHRLDLTLEQMKTGTHIDIPITGLASNAVYSVWIEGIDRAGNEGKAPEINGITFDDIPPEIAITSPMPDAFINAKTVGLSTNETLSKAKVVWTWVEGNADPAGTHESTLVGNNLQEGAYPDVNFNPAPSLVSDAKYKVVFQGTDRAGNASTFELGTVYFDDQPPVISGIFPPSNGFTNLNEISYELNELLTMGTLTWTPVDGSSFTPTDMAGNELNPGIFAQAKLQNQTDLKDGIAYNIEVFAVDRAGNESTMTLAENVRYDKSKPKFTSVFPTTSSRVNSQLIQWTVDESLVSGKYTWIHMGGTADPAAPHSFDLTPELLTAGSFDNTSLGDLNLVADAMYRITLEGTDLAGNTGKKFIMSIVYDDKPPKLEIKYPESNTAVNHLDVAYFMDEGLSKGQFVYTRVGGQPDPNSPVTFDLTGVELETIFESPKIPKNPPVLSDGTIYNIQFVGEDIATNSSKSNVVENVKYDITRPVITIYYPTNKSIFRGTEIDIEISEDLKDGKMVWSRTGGLRDRVTKHKIPLYDQYLTKGRHEKAKLPMDKSLSSSVVYSLGVEAQDFAGNQAEPVLVEFIEFVRNMAGNWYYKGQIIEVVWVFEPDETGLKGNFMQGLSLGTKISDQEKGRFTIDLSRKPWSITLDMDNPDKNRISLFEFKDNTHIKVVTGTRKPSGMNDGEVMEYEWRPE